MLFPATDGSLEVGERLALAGRSPANAYFGRHTSLQGAIP